MMARAFRWHVCMILLCAPGSVALAAGGDPIDAAFILDAGTFFMSTDTRVRVDGERTGVLGTDFNFDETFGLGDADRFRIDAFWRLADRHALRAMYFENERSGTRSVMRDLRFGDQTFPVGATASARSEFTVAQLSYDYAFVKRENYELAGSLGVHMLDIHLSLDGTVSAQDGSLSRTIEASARTSAPLPVVGLRGIWQWPARFYVTAQAQYFYLRADPYSGRIADLKAALVWQATDHVGIGLGYNEFALRFDVDDEERFSGRLRWDYSGPVAFVSIMF